MKIKSFLFVLFFLAIGFPSFAEDTIIASANKLDFGHGLTQKNLFITNNTYSNKSWHMSNSAKWLSSSSWSGHLNGQGVSTPDAPYYPEILWPHLDHPWYIINPYGITIDHEGNMYVIQDDSSRIQKYNQWGEFLFELTPQMNAQAKLTYPENIAVDSVNNLYIVDGNKIKKFDNRGQFLSAFGLIINGQPHATFSPWGIAIDEHNNIFVTDKTNACVYKFDSQGNFITKWGSPGMEPGQFYTNNGLFFLGIVVDSHGNVYVADNHFYRIQKFDGQGNLITQWGFGTKDLTTPFNGNPQYGQVFTMDARDILYIGHDTSGFLGRFDSRGRSIPFQNVPRYFDTYESLSGGAVDAQGNIYLVGGIRSVIKFDSYGHVVDTFKAWDKSDGKFFWPYGVDLGADSLIYICDETLRLQAFNEYGHLMKKLDLSSLPLNAIQGISQILVSNNFIYVAQNGTIYKLNKNSGNLLATWSHTLDNNKPLYEFMSLDSQGHVWTVTTTVFANGSYGNPTINRLDDNGMPVSGGMVTLPNNSIPLGFAIAPNDDLFIYLNDFGGNGYIFDVDHTNYIHTMQWPAPNNGENLTIDHKGYLYFDTSDTYMIYKYDTKGHLITSWGGTGTTDGKVQRIAGIKVDSNGKVYVVEHGNNRVQVFTQSTQPLQVSINRAFLPQTNNSGYLTVYDDNSPLRAYISVSATEDQRPLPAKPVDKT